MTRREYVVDQAMAAPPVQGVVVRDEKMGHLIRLYSEEQRQERLAEYEVRYALWKFRQDRVKAHDRKVRAFLLGFVSFVGLTVVTVVGFAAYQAYLWIGKIAGWVSGHETMAWGGGAVAILVLAALFAGVGTCVTVVTLTHHH